LNIVVVSLDGLIGWLEQDEGPADEDDDILPALETALAVLRKVKEGNV